MKRKNFHVNEDDQFEPEKNPHAEDPDPEPSSDDGQLKKKPPKKEKFKGPSKKQRNHDYKFEQEDVDQIENAIIKYGLNYRAIHDQNFRSKTSMNKMKEFINSDEMQDVKLAATSG